MWISSQECEGGGCYRRERDSACAQARTSKSKREQERARVREKASERWKIFDLDVLIDRAICVIFQKEI